MKHVSKTLIVFLLASIVFAVIAWRQHSNLTEKRLELLTMQEKDALTKKLLSEIQKKTYAHEHAPLSVLRNALKFDNAKWQSATLEAINRIKERISQNPATAPVKIPESPSGPHGTVLPQLLDDPKYAALVKEMTLAQKKSEIVRRTIGLKLKTEQQTKLAALYSELSLVDYDFTNASEKAGIDRRSNEEAFRLWLELTRKLGKQADEIIGKAESEKAGRNLMVFQQRTLNIDSLSERLSYSNEPLSNEQTTRMRDLLINSEDDSRNFAMQYFSGNPAKQVEPWDLSSAFETKASEILSPLQMVAVAELQAVERAKQRDRELGEQLRQLKKSQPSTDNQRSQPPQSGVREGN